MGQKDIDLRASMQCVECCQFFRKDTDYVVVKKFDYDGYSLGEEFYCPECSEKEVLSDSTSVYDVDGNRQFCPDCDSTAIQLIPHSSADHQFTGAKFICRACGLMQDLDLEL